VSLWREIPAGAFMMGSPDGDGDDDEHPRHRVNINSPFLCGVVPVTNVQYAAFDSGKQPYQWEGVDQKELEGHPVVNVTWFESVAFCQWLSAAYQKLRGARLPTEEEWEYACRAGTDTRYWSGDDESDLSKVGWYEENSDDRTHRVGGKPVSPWGLYDIHGNVEEWTLSRYTDSFSGREQGYRLDPLSVRPADLAVDASGGDLVTRGGGCWFAADWARAAYRYIWNPGVVNQGQGFRVVVPASPELAIDT
jgi:formylglycine-generating enzyme required for sulfatase activity